MTRAWFCTRTGSASLRCSTRTSSISWSKTWRMLMWVSIPTRPCSIWPPLIWFFHRPFIIWRRLISHSSAQRKPASCTSTQCSRWMLTLLNRQCQHKSLLPNLSLSLFSDPLSMALPKLMELGISGQIMVKHLNSSWIVEPRTFSMRQAVHPLWVPFHKTITTRYPAWVDLAK